MSWRLRLIVAAPVVLFVALTLIMSSCGGGGGCGGSFDEFGDFVPGVCPTPGAEAGFNLELIFIGAGTVVASTPTPAPLPTIVGAKTPSPTATPVATLVASAAPTAGAVGQLIPFIANGLYIKGQKSIVTDITNSSSTLWSSSNPNVLAPPQPPPMGGIYQALAPGCSCAVASSGGVSANPVSVGVYPVGGMPSPCPICPTQGPTSTPTPTRKAEPPVSAQIEQLQADHARVSGVLQWTFPVVSPIVSPLVPSSDGNLYFLTGDGFLHALDAKGHQRLERRARGSSIAVSPEGIVYALGLDGALQAISSSGGKPLWTLSVDSQAGPLAASSSAVYFQEGSLLVAASAQGAVLWRTAAPDPISTAALTDDGAIIAASNGGSVIAIASDGTRRWSFTPEGGFAGEIAVRAGLVYLGSESGRVYAVDGASGAVQWTYDSAAAVGAGPVLNPGGPIFFGSDAIYALNSDGSLAWSKTLAKTVLSPLASDGAGGVLAPLDDDLSAMLNSDGGLSWATRSFGPVERAIVSPSGVLYVASQGRIFAVK